MHGNFIRRIILSRINKFRNLDGWLTDNEGVGLYLTARKVVRNGTVVEIGSWQGKSTYCISKGLKSGKLYAIDPFNAGGGFDVENETEYRRRKGNMDLLEGFIKNMEQLKVLHKIVIKKGYSYQFDNEFGEINFLFIDGDHSIEGCTADFNLYAPKIVRGGFIAFHDYYEERDELGPTYVIKNFVLNSGNFEFVNKYDSLWVAKKIS